LGVGAQNDAGQRRHPARRARDHERLAAHRTSRQNDDRHLRDKTPTGTYRVHRFTAQREQVPGAIPAAPIDQL
jgi:hypothetical protein